MATDGTDETPTVVGGSRAVPPQVVPRPPDWRPGRPAPWEGLGGSARRELSLARVLGALDGAGQLGAVPDPSDPSLSPFVEVVDPSQLRVATVASAVLAALFEEAGETRVVLTRRSSRLRSHRGEVSFPGGRVEPDEDSAAAACREAFEEVDLDPAQVSVVGWLHPVLTFVSASLIMPVVATLAGRPTLTPFPAEVERVFDVALADLVAPEVFHEERWRIPGRRVPGSADGGFAVWFYEAAGELIWGATARMLTELLTVVLGVSVEGPGR